MKTGRPDYDVTLEDHSIPSNEPRFLARAQDIHAAELVRKYAQLLFNGGGEVAQVEKAMQLADAMDRWPTKKAPDMKFTDAQRKQLRYQFGRRAWQNVPDELDERIMYAQQRSRREALADARAEVAGELDRLGREVISLRNQLAMKS